MRMVYARMVYAHMFTHVCTVCMCLWVPVCVHTQTCVLMCVCLWVPTCVHTGVRACVCVLMVCSHARTGSQVAVPELTHAQQDAVKSLL